MGLADLKEGLAQLFSLPNYADNLGGVNLLEQLRAATDLELEGPSDELNAQVVKTINDEIVSGKNCWDVADLLKKRLHSSKPHKQWLAVHLVGQVLRECSASLVSHRDDLLMEVARTWSRPAKASSPEGKRTRAACNDLLLSFGEAGIRAQLTVARLDGAWADRNGMEHVADSCMSLPEPKMAKAQSHLTLFEERTLNDMLRRATDKELLDPNEEINAQVVELINAEARAGVDIRDVIDIVRQRLHSHKPRKQWLAIHLVARILRDCEKAIGTRQADLLEEVAKVMMRPAKPDSEEGNLTRDTAMELLHSYGALGDAAIRSANRVDGLWGSGDAVHVDTQTTMAVPERSNTTPLSGVEARTLKEHINAATAEELPEPSAELNAQVAETVKALILQGKEPLDIAQLLKDELRSFKPRRQWLAVLLVGHVVQDCQDTLAGCQVGLLEEVAKVMIRPAKPDSEEGKLTREAAMHVLRVSGAAGDKAFVAANLLDGAWGSAVAPHVDTQSCMAVPEREGEAPVADAILQVARTVVDMAKANGELLRDILAAQAKEDGASTSRQSGHSAFEDQLVKDLVERVSVIRDRLQSQKPQLQSLSTPEADALKTEVDAVVAALEATLAGHHLK